jgi:hypothetical protein
MHEQALAVVVVVVRARDFSNGVEEERLLVNI